MTSTLTINTDGGSRGNPGPAAAAAVFQSAGRVIDQQSWFLGHTTNNVAEYTAVLNALQYLRDHSTIFSSFLAITFILDSELVVKQLTGLYKIKHPGLQELSFQINLLLQSLPQKINFIHVKRHLNRLPDSLLNHTLDKYT